jgi:hypothetical protein
MVCDHWPPRVRSKRDVAVVTPAGPHHASRCAGEVQASHTVSIGARKRRVTTVSRSAAVVVA